MPADTLEGAPVGAALSRLDPQTRAMVVLRFLSGYRAREIAAMLGSTPGP